MRALLFWISAGLLAWTQGGYALLLALLSRGVSREEGYVTHQATQATPGVSLVIAAYAEEDVIAAKVANARALDYPELEIVVAVDGSVDATAARAREAGADIVLELERGGKMRAQDAGVAAASHDVLAFGDANSMWAPDALRELVAVLESGADYVCGQVTFVNDAGTNREGLYWRYEMWLRERESALHSVTGGNGAIYAVRREAYVVPDVPMGHDLLLPFTLVQQGRRAVYAPAARATEKMVPTIEGEWQRKRRMMTQAWAIVLHGGLLRLGAYPPLYALMIVSHRILRYAAPFLHVVALVTAPRLLKLPQLALLAAAFGPRRVPIARYYVLTQASIAFGLFDHLRHGTPETWEPAEGTR